MQDIERSSVLYDEQQVKYYQNEIDNELRWETRVKNHRDKSISNFKTGRITLVVLSLLLLLLFLIGFFSGHTINAEGKIVKAAGVPGYNIYGATVVAVSFPSAFVIIGIIATIIWMIRSFYNSKGMAGYRGKPYMLYGEIYAESSNRMKHLNNELNKAVVRAEASKMELKIRRESEGVEMKSIDILELRQAKLEGTK